jgi:hypothetical protein
MKLWIRAMSRKRLLDKTKGGTENPGTTFFYL